MTVSPSGGTGPPWILLLAVFLLINAAFFDGFFVDGQSITIDTQNPCKHHDYPQVGTPVMANDGESIYREIDQNQTHLYEFAIDTKNTTLLNQKDTDRKILFNLEPCQGIVYLFVRKTRPCYPDPYSCLKTTQVGANDDQFALPQPSQCLWTHFVSKIDGTRDGAATLFEFPLTSTRYYISVHGLTRATYTFMAMTDIGAFPRPGGQGQIFAYQTKLPLEVDLSWKPAFFRPKDVGGREIGKILKYHVYSAMLLDKDKRTNAAVFLTSNKIMNTVCGLQNNTDRPFNATFPDQSCGANGYCNQTIHGVIVNRRYVFNVVAETDRGYRAAYSGLIVKTDWAVKRQEGEDSEVMNVLPPLFGGILGLVVTLYIWMVNWY